MKKNLIFTAVLSALVFSACSGEIDSNEFMNNDEEYRACMALIGDNDLDENGFYNNFDDVSDSTEESSVPDGKILVSLGSNNTMDLQYYRDAKCSESDLIKDTICYVNPGDIIYATDPLFKTAGTDQKQFDTFKVYYYNENGERNHATNLECVNEPGASVLKVLQIPENYGYTNLSVVPVSTYKDRVLYFYDYYIDKNGEETALSNKWEVITSADMPYSTTGDDISFNPFENYIVKLYFNKDEYYFKNSSPAPWHSDNNEGYVEFHQQSADEAITKFVAELVPYTPVTLDLEEKGIAATYTISSSATKQTESSDKLVEVRGIKGDYLSCKITDDPDNTDLFKKIKNNEITIENLKLISNDNKGTWVFEIIDEKEKIIFDPSKFSYDNGKIEFYYNNNRVNSPIELNEGAVLKYKVYPDTDYYIEGDQKTEYEYIFHYAYSEYEIEHFKFVKKERKRLDQPDKGGKIIYKLDGNIIPEDQDYIYYLKGSNHLTVEFEVDPNYKLSTDKAINGMEIEFEDNCDVVKIDGKTVGELFVTTNESEADLIITIDDSIGKELIFQSENWKIDRNGFLPIEWLKNKQISYRLGFFTTYSGSVSPANGFTINVSNGNITKDKALKFSIDSTDSNGEKYQYIRYSNSVPNSVEIPVDTSKIYNSYTITIEKVDIEAINFDRYSVLNADVSFRFTDEYDNPLISNGQLIDGSREVEMLITPKPGYELYNKDTLVSEYKISCKYSELLEKYINAIGDIDAKLKGVQ